MDEIRFGLPTSAERGIPTGVDDPRIRINTRQLSQGNDSLCRVTDNRMPVVVRKFGIDGSTQHYNAVRCASRDRVPRRKTSLQFMAEHGTKRQEARQCQYNEASDCQALPCTPETCGHQDKAQENEGHQ